MSQEPHMSIVQYVIVFFALVVGTVITYFVALFDLDGMAFPGTNTLVALLIAFIKTSIVVWYFMHVKWSTRLIWLSVVSGIFWLAIMFAYIMQDYLTRSVGNTG